jgi:hypothetical protein
MGDGDGIPMPWGLGAWVPGRLLPPLELVHVALSTFGDEIGQSLSHVRIEASAAAA